VREGKGERARTNERPGSAPEAQELRWSDLDEELVLPEQVKKLEVSRLDGAALVLVKVHGEGHGEAEEQHLALWHRCHELVLLGTVPHALPHLRHTPERHLGSAIGVLEQHREAAQEASERQVRLVLALHPATAKAPNAMNDRDVARKEGRRPKGAREHSLGTVADGIGEQANDNKSTMAAGSHTRCAPNMVVATGAYLSNGRLKPPSTIPTMWIGR